jgi:hypothetical protein
VPLCLFLMRLDIVNDRALSVERPKLAERGPMPIACSARQRSTRVGP